MTADRRRTLEIGGRVVFVLVVLRVFPDVFWSDVHYWWHKMNHLGLHSLPYRDFVWEFPPLTVLPMAPATFLKDAVSVFTVIFATLMALAEYASLELLRARWPERARSLSRYWYAVVFPLSTVAYFRFDYVPALFAVLALLAIERGRSPATAVALGFATKLWPVVIGVVLVIERRYREVAISMAAVAAIVIGWYAFSPSGFHDFLRFRRGDGFQVESSVGAVALLAGARPTVDFGSWVVGLGTWRWVDPVTSGAWLVLAERRRLRRGGASTTPGRSSVVSCSRSCFRPGSSRLSSSRGVSPSWPWHGRATSASPVWPSVQPWSSAS